MGRIETERFICEIADDVAVVKLRSVLVAEYTQAEKLGPELREVSDSHPFRIMVIDCSALRFVTSTLLTAFVNAHVHLAKSDRALRVCGLNSVMRETFRTTKLDRVISVFENVRAATRE